MWKPITVVVAIATIIMVVAFKEVSELRNDNKRLRENQRVLMEQRQTAMSECQRYRVADSLSAAKVDALQLTLAEYKRYRAKDLAQIKSIGLDKKDLEAVVGVQMQTLKSIRTELFDDEVKSGGGAKVRKTFAYKSEWADVNGCIDVDSGVVDLNIYTRENLHVAETIVRKRFLGCLWKTRKIKNRRVDVVSANPNTEITGVDFVTIQE